MMALLLPRDVPCTECRAKIGEQCHSKYRPEYPARTHLTRWKGIGVKKPTLDQLFADYEDGKARDQKVMSANIKAWREGARP